MKSLWSNLGTVLCAVELCTKSVILSLSLSHATEHSTAHNTVPKLLQRLFIESSVIVFHDSYLESSSSPSSL